MPCRESEMVNSLKHSYRVLQLNCSIILKFQSSQEKCKSGLQFTVSVSDANFARATGRRRKSESERREGTQGREGGREGDAEKWRD